MRGCQVEHEFGVGWHAVGHDGRRGEFAGSRVEAEQDLLEWRVACVDAQSERVREAPQLDLLFEQDAWQTAGRAGVVPSESPVVELCGRAVLAGAHGDVPCRGVEVISVYDVCGGLLHGYK